MGRGHQTLPVSQSRQTEYSPERETSSAFSFHVRAQHRLNGSRPGDVIPACQFQGGDEWAQDRTSKAGAKYLTVSLSRETGKGIGYKWSVMSGIPARKLLMNMLIPSTLVHWLLGTFFKLLNPFIDPVTREKLKFDQNLRDFVPPSHLLKAYGGDVDFIYDHDVYWPAMVALTARKREEQTERWIRGGKKVGELEAYLKGGIEKGLGGGEDTRVENQSVEARGMSEENGEAV